LFHARRNMQKQLLDLLDHPPADLADDAAADDAAAGASASADTSHKSARAARSQSR